MQVHTGGLDSSIQLRSSACSQKTLVDKEEEEEEEEKEEAKQDEKGEEEEEEEEKEEMGGCRG